MTILHKLQVGIRARHLVIASLAVLGLLVAESVIAQSSRIGTGELIGVREIQLKPGVDPAEFDRFVAEQFNPAWEGAMPGVRAFIAKAKRGEKMGTYVHFIIFDSENTRDLMVPDGQLVPWAAELFEKVPTFEEEFNSYVEGGAGYFETYTDYVVLR